MIEFIYQPIWFFGKDAYIDSIAVIVLALISFYAYRYYKLSKEKKFFIVAAAFVFIAASFVFKILTNITLLTVTKETVQAGVLTIITTRMNASEVPLLISLTLSRAFMLFGLFAFYDVYRKFKHKDRVLIGSLLILLIIASLVQYYIYHLAALILLSAITFHLFTRKGTITRCFGRSFAIIALSQLIMAFTRIHSLTYVIAELIQLTGFVFLLFTFIRVLRRGKKKQT